MILCDCSAVLAVVMRNVLHEGACTGVSWSVSASGACRFVPADPLVDLVWSWQVLSELCWVRKNICKHRSKKGVPNNKSINNSIQIAKNQPKINQKSTNNPPKVNRDRFGKKVGSRTPTNCEILCFFLAFLRHLADSGCHFGQNWIPKGVHKSCFWASSWKNDEKSVSKNETPKNMKCWSKFDPKMGGFGR